MLLSNKHRFHFTSAPAHMNFGTWLYSCYLSCTHSCFDSCYPLLCCESLEEYWHRQSLLHEEELIPIREECLRYEAITSEDTAPLQDTDDPTDSTEKQSWYLLFQDPYTCISRYSCLLSPLQKGPPVLGVDERSGRVKDVAFDPEVRVLTWSMKARVVSKIERRGDGLDSRGNTGVDNGVDGHSKVGKSDIGTSPDTDLISIDLD